MLIFLSAQALQGQSNSGSGSSDLGQSPISADCSDPLLANTPDCSDQTQQGATPLLNPSAAGQYPSQMNSTGGQYGSQAVNPNRNYSDIEQLSRRTTSGNQAGFPPESQNGSQNGELTPEPLTEFQKFVASTTGQVLPIFGANLFRRVPSTFAPLEMTPVPADYVVGPGDELRIRVWGQVNSQSNVRVDRSGEIYLPQVGPVHVAGTAFAALAAQLRAEIGRVYRNFDLTVDLGQTRAIQVYVTGQARRPGVYTVSSLSTLVDTVFSSGGPTPDGSLRHIQLRRGKTVVTDFDLYDLLIRGDHSKDVKLESGDVIFIPPVGPQAAVVGSVRIRGIYELLDGEPLSALLSDAGGVSAVAAETHVSIERIDDHRDRHAMEVAYDAAGLATTVADGDLIRVDSIVPLYRKTVILRGNTANPGRFAWHPGMHVSDLIPDKEALITRNYWWQRAQLGLPAPEFEPLQGVANLRQPMDNNPITLQLPGPPATSEVPHGNEQERAGSSALGGVENTPSSTQRTDAQELGTVQQRSGGNALGSVESMSTSVPRTVGQEAPRTEVRELAPEIDWNYAVVERLDPQTLKTTLIPFDLGALVLEHDASQNLELEAGDVVSIFSQADIRVPIAQQTKLVRLEGEFAHPGIYTANPGETLRHLVVRAGGLTPNAYLYGSEFTRESTRALQQARMDEYVESLNMRIQHSTLALVAAPTGSTMDMANSAAAQSTERDLLASLRQTRATGRIVLQFQPGMNGVDTLPETPLEDGDRFSVPPVPAVINVVGAVYDQNSFLYAASQRAGTYLRMAGGPNSEADRKHEFIIRANGQVISRMTTQGVWGDEFDNLRMNPGDTLVVPEKVFKPSSLRGFIDWSQMFSQFALGAAALDVIH